MTLSPRTFRCALLTLLVTLAAALSSCEQVHTTKEVLPKVTDLGPDGRPLEPVMPVLDPSQPPINPRARLSIERLVFKRRDWQVNVALESLAAAKIDEPAKRALKASGFYVSQLPLNRLALFRANLPDPASVQVSHIMPMADYSPIMLVSRITGRRVGRAVDASGKLKTVQMIGGTYRLLARLAADKKGHTLVDMVPQHYFPKVSVQLRPPGKRVMDGQVFEAMRVKQAIGPGRVWLIWAKAPPPVSRDMTQGMTDDSTIGTRRKKRGGEDQPPLLGTMMLNGLRGQEPVRMVLVVYVTD